MLSPDSENMYINYITFLHCNNKIHLQQEKSLEAKNSPHMAIVYKRQNMPSNTTCTPRHDKENSLLWKKGEIIQVKCTIGLWFLSYALPLINIMYITSLISIP